MSQRASLGPYFYEARHFGIELGRFRGPDTIVPSPGNPQSLNRYSYVYNNPLKYNDPSGHIANWVVGGIVGGLVGGGLYLVNELRQGDLNLNINVSSVGGFKVDAGDWGDLAAATGMGTAAGLLIATPGGQAAGVSMAVNLVSDHVGNLASGSDFSATQHLVTGGVGLVEGAVGAKVSRIVDVRAAAAGLDAAATKGAQMFGQVANSAIWGGVDGAIGARLAGGNMPGGAVRGAAVDGISTMTASPLLDWAEAANFPGLGKVGTELLWNLVPQITFSLGPALFPTTPVDRRAIPLSAGYQAQ